MFPDGALRWYVQKLPIDIPSRTLERKHQNLRQLSQLYNVESPSFVHNHVPRGFMARPPFVVGRVPRLWVSEVVLVHAVFAVKGSVVILNFTVGRGPTFARHASRILASAKVFKSSHRLA